MKQHKKKKDRTTNEVSTETYPENIEIEIKQHKKKKKRDKNERCAETYSDYEPETKQPKKKKKDKNELPIETYSDYKETEIKMPKKKKEKNQLPAETYSDYNETEIKQHKKKKDKNELPAETHSDYNETETKQHKKKKRKERNDMAIETYSDCYEAEINQHKKKRGKNEISTETNSNYDDTDLPFKSDTCTSFFDEPEINFRYKHKHGKKHKEEKDSNFKEIDKQHEKKNKKVKDVLSNEIYFYHDETEIHQEEKKKEKLGFFTNHSPGCDNDKNELCTKKKKKKKKNSELENLSHEESQNVKNANQNLLSSGDMCTTFFVEPEINFEYSHKNRKKHKKEKENHFKAMEIFRNNEEAQIQAQKQKKDKMSNCVNESDFSSKTEISNNRKNKIKHKENLNVLEEFNVSRDLSKERKKNKYVSAIEVNTDYESEKNSLDNHGKKNKKKRNILEGFAEKTSKKLKRNKTHTENTEVCIPQLDVTSKYNVIEAQSKHKKPNVSATKNSTDLEAAEILLSISERRKERNSDKLLTSNFNAEIDELHENSYVDSINKNNERGLTADDSFESTVKKKKRKKEKRDFNLENDTVFYTQLKNQNVYCDENECDLNRSKKHKSKKKIKNNAYSSEDFSVDQSNNCPEIDIDDFLLKECISYLHDNGNESNDTARDASDTCQLSDHAKKRQQKKSALNVREINHSDRHIINEKEIANVNSTDKLLEKNVNKDEENVSEIVPENTYFPKDIDYNDDPVEFEVPPLHQFETVCRLSEKQKLHLGPDVCIKSGSYTTAEDRIIQRNFEDFASEYNIPDPYSLFGTGRYGKDIELLKFLKAKHFYIKLARDLNNRTLHSIYKRARIILNPLKCSGKLTENDIENLKKLQISLNKKWHQIGDTLGSTAERCAETYRWHEKNITKGTFTKEEEAQLIEAIKKVSGSSDYSCSNIRSISWDAVASHVPSRNGSQCRMYWANNLAWAPGSEKIKWNEECYRRLIKILKNQNTENPSNIDWHQIYESFLDYAPSDLYVQKRWYYLRSRVPKYADKSFKEILNRLCDMYFVHDYEY